MAIIYSYPEKTSPAGGDFLVITDSEQPAPNKNRTKSLTLDNLASYVVSSTSGITGSGTLNTIAMFTPNGQKIGDSIMTFTTGPDTITVGGRLSVTGDLAAQGRASFTGLYARFTCPVQDGNNSPGTAGQFLSSTGTGVEWVSDSVYTWDLAANTGVPQAIASGDTVTIIGGTNISTQVNPPFLGDTQVLVDLDDSVTLAGTLTVNGDTVIGDVSTDILTVNSEATFNTNVNVTGIAGSPVLTIGHTNAITFIDSVGTVDLRISRDLSNNSIIQDSSPGDLILASDTELEIKSGVLGENFAKFTKDGPIELYYDNVKKFETASSSIKILGVPVHADNAAALAAGLIAGEVYRTGDLLKIVH